MIIYRKKLHINTKYTSRREGWAADIYDFGNTAIVTGYAPFGNIRPGYELCQKYEHAADINVTVNPEKADNSTFVTRLSNCNKTQLKAIAAELETVQKRLEWLINGRY